MIYRSAFILPASIRAPANQLAAQIGIDPEGLLTTVSVPLVPAGGPDDAEPTHYGCCGILSDAQRAQLEAASGSFPGALWWRWHETGPDEGRVVASWDGQRIGEPWGWAQSLDAAGLKAWRVEAPSQL